jgi:hypothetical protein
MTAGPIVAGRLAPAVARNAETSLKAPRRAAPKSPPAKRWVVPAVLKGKHRAAYVIGRIVMAWGLIEQKLYTDVVRFQQATNPKLYPHDADVASTFDGRLKLWRQLASSACSADRARMSHVDRALGKIKKLGLVRHHLAHGYAIFLPGSRTRSGHWPSEPFLEMVEHREAVTRIKKYTEMARKNPGLRVWASQLQPRYTISELEVRLRELEDLGDDLMKASDAILSTPRLAKLPKRGRQRQSRSNARNG